MDEDDGVNSSWGGYVKPSGSVTFTGDSIGPESYDNTIFIGCNSGFYMEFMCKSVFRFPTWSIPNGQDDIVWIDVGAGSWNRGGIAYPYAAGHTHTGASLDDELETHVYSGSTGLGQLHYYPRIYIEYNANGGSSTPSKQTKYIGSSLKLASAISRTGYNFLGWSTSSTATSASYAAEKSLDTQSWNSCGASYSGNNGWTELMPDHTGNTVKLYAIWKIKSYANTINHWVWGFKNKEGNNGNKDAFHLGDTTFNQNYNSTFTMGTDRATTNVLYGVTFSDPTRTGYTFKNWTIGRNCCNRNKSWSKCNLFKCKWFKNKTFFKNNRK